MNEMGREEWVKVRDFRGSNEECEIFREGEGIWNRSIVSSSGKGKGICSAGQRMRYPDGRSPSPQESPLHLECGRRLNSGGVDQGSCCS